MYIRTCAKVSRMHTLSEWLNSGKRCKCKTRLKKTLFWSQKWISPHPFPLSLYGCQSLMCKVYTCTSLCSSLSSISTILTKPLMNQQRREWKSISQISQGPKKNHTFLKKIFLFMWHIKGNETNILKVFWSRNSRLEGMKFQVFNWSRNYSGSKLAPFVPFNVLQIGLFNCHW